MRFLVSKVSGGKYGWTLIDQSGKILASDYKPCPDIPSAVSQCEDLQAQSALIPGATIQTPPVPVTTLGPADFTYIGDWDLNTSLSVGAQIAWTQGLTGRRVNGELRFMTLVYMGTAMAPQRMIEFALPAAPGQQVLERRSWPEIFSGGGIPNQNDCSYGLSWEQSKQRLWTCFGVNYPGSDWAGSPFSFQTRTLNDDGSISNLQGPWGLAGVSQRCVAGSVVAVPADFQATYGTGPYAALGGGEFSLQVAGGLISLGPTLYTFGEPTAYPAFTAMSGFKTGLDFRDGTQLPAWYPAAAAPVSYDRGVRNSDVQEEYDDWTSPAPDGLGRWTWGDSVHQTGQWITGPNKRGIVYLASLCSGKAAYVQSALFCERTTFEFMTFDPAQVGAAIQGKVPPWSVKPVARWPVTLPGFGFGSNGPQTSGRIAAGWFDDVGSSYYALGATVGNQGGPAGASRLFGWKVAA